MPTAGGSWSHVTGWRVRTYWEVEGTVNWESLIEGPPEIRITLHDLHRLERLLSSLEGASQPGWWRLLRAEVDRAALVDDPQEQPPFVRIGSTVVFRDESGTTYEGVLTLPGQALERVDAIPVISPVGAALLGLSEGQTITFRRSDGRSGTLTVLKIDAED